MSKRTSQEANDPEEERAQQMRCWHFLCDVCGAAHTGSHKWLRPDDWAKGKWLCIKCAQKRVVEKTIEKGGNNDNGGNNNDKGGYNNDKGGGGGGYDNDVAMAT
jgi:hypothetical protein